MQQHLLFGLFSGTPAGMVVHCYHNKRVCTSSSLYSKDLISCHELRNKGWGQGQNKIMVSCGKYKM